MPETPKVPWLKSGLRLLPTILMVFFLDQSIKTMVSFLYTLGDAHAITSFFSIRLAYNKGAAFSFLSNAGGWQVWFLSLIAIAVSLWILITLRKTVYANRRIYSWGLALILAGALGNLTDRLLQGQVVDFLDFHLYGWHWPTFNIADVAIFIGVAHLLLDAWLEHRSMPNKSDDAKRKHQEHQEKGGV